MDEVQRHTRNGFINLLQKKTNYQLFVMCGEMYIKTYPTHVLHNLRGALEGLQVKYIEYPDAIYVEALGYHV